MLLQDISCVQRRKMIFGQVLEACGSQWHPSCFKCNECHSTLSSSYVERGGWPFCDKCANQSSNEPYKGKPTTVVQSNSKQVAQRNQESKEIASNINKGKLFCAECGQLISIGEAVTLGSATFHEYCFVCTQCKKPLSETGFKEQGGAPYCPNCLSGAANQGGGGFCAGCGKKLSGAFVTAVGSKWHKECFVCISCHQPFSSGYAEKDGQAYCPSCIQKVTPRTTTKTVVTSGQATGGFIVDPRTGQKKYRS